MGSLFPSIKKSDDLVTAHFLIYRLWFPGTYRNSTDMRYACS